MSRHVLSLVAAIFACAGGALLAVALVLDLSGRQPLGPRRWLLVGGLAFATAAALTAIGHYRHWPRSQLAMTEIVQLVLVIAGWACLVIGIAAVRRSQRP